MSASADTEAAAARRRKAALGTFERYLTLWWHCENALRKV
jgi:hypothetical protein